MIKISVAIATYNGEKYIKEQIESILNQTIPVDEIIISDDGSSDSTLAILEDYARSSIIVLTDNERHGFCGNFEHAINHCTGDYIFLADQDDIWMPDKVERTIAVFIQNSSATCVFSNGVLINESKKEIEGRFNEIDVFDFSKGTNKVDRDSFLETCVSQPLALGMVMCIKRSLLEIAIPFPEMFGFHDQWLLFCSIGLDSCYYLNEKLVFRRLHGENTGGNSAYKGSFVDRFKKITKRIVKNINNKKTKSDSYFLGKAMLGFLEKYDLTDTQAYSTAKRVYEIGSKQIEAYNSNRFVGAIKLIKLFCSDMRYRRCGTASFLYDLVGILFHKRI